MGYIACEPLKFGDRTILPGEPVPVERGRNYRGMLQRGEIQVTVEQPEPARRPRRSVDDGE